MKIRAVLLCKKRQPRAQLRKMLLTQRHIELVAECKSGSDAIELIQKQNPDLIFFQKETPSIASHISVKARGSTIFIKAQEIDYIEAAHNSVIIHVGVAYHVLRGNLTELQTRLSDEQFFRVNRSAIVNLMRVKEVFRMRGQPVIVLQSGKALSLTRKVSIREIRRRLEFR